MTDFIDRLGAELSRAASAEHQPQAAPQRALPYRRNDARPQRRWRRRRRGRLAVVLAAFVVAAGSAVAAVSLTQPSAPLSGRVPQSAFSLGFSHYDFEVFPEIEGGQAGWCVWIYNVPAVRQEGGMGSCGPAAVGPAAYVPGPTGSSAPNAFVWLMVPARVAAVRLPGAKTIRTVTDGRLPAGFRGVAFFLHSQSADPLRGLAALDSAGRPVKLAGLGATPSTGVAVAGLEPAIYWANRQPLTRGRCSITAANLTGLRAQWGRIVRHLRATPGATPSTFLSCASTWFRFHGHLFYSAVLTNAVHPGASSVTLPGLSPVAGARGVYHRELPPRFIAVNSIQPLVARRISLGWLVVESSAPLKQRVTVLAALSLR